MLAVHHVDDGVLLGGFVVPIGQRDPELAWFADLRGYQRVNANGKGQKKALRIGLSLTEHQSGKDEEHGSTDHRDDLFRATRATSGASTGIVRHAWTRRQSSRNADVGCRRPA